MPSKVGRVRMPANNRLPVSASLKTSEIWKKSVGYDPYASVEELNSKKETKNEEINEKAQHLFNIARVTGNISTTIPGACTRCNHVGHLSYQCRNFINLDEYDIRNDMKGDEENELKERKNLGLISSTDDDSSSDSESDNSDRDAKKSKEKRRKRKHKDHKHRKDRHKKHHKHRNRDDKKCDDKKCDNKKCDDKLINKKKEKHKSHHYDEKKDRKSKYRESDKKHKKSKER
ncbi:uncharacterized protein PY17X_1109300 [Plasmodium yoelii]|uniref:Uncharacterized protein n=3 Tax=Plasmodium yoelii TaxID=5861 RepID=A0AAF0B3L3_PLAYO|nr:uncharacterized protein PY17X_1109300 [Plasmodium yoelii]EAA19458.1 expressed protein [Plasmodium yoelii yoelii]WBY58468.1 hypothetical protein Py17XNL_001105502 [Plasmodium yoelii yoelii]CDU18787.1 conserved Plasmodium protein, unknown function [Plasmodium yoelii]VTZ79372.1 conserved protein, unknown function [Plasmodium yoelii]|eukprot:XP_727893.1 uncharacterized protein PY17X_1109300 [Plasmodium yoelii]